jgi:hypothetical protein
LLAADAGQRATVVGVEVHTCDCECEVGRHRCHTR